MRPTSPLRAVSTTSVGAVLYIRQSITRVKKDAHGNRTTELDTVSPELQQAAGEEYCRRHGYHVEAVVTDLNRTGRTLKRRSVQKALGYIEEGRAKVIVVWKWSRLARNRRDFSVTCDYVEVKLGGRIESSTEATDITTATGRLNRGILAEFAAFESDRTGEIIKEVQDNRVRQGLPGNGKPRFGYRNIDKRFVPDPELGDVLAEMYSRYIGGLGYSAIAVWLNDRGVLTTYGGHWRHETVRSVLNSGFGAGLMQHRGELVPGIHKPVITGETWQQYVAARDSRYTLSSRAKASRYLLVGLIRCGLCGDVMTARPDRYKHIWYRCKSRTLRRCPNGMVKLVEAEAQVMKWLRGLVDDLDAATEANTKRQHRVESAQSKASAIDRKISDIDKALTRLTIDKARDLIPEQAYVDARDELMASRVRLAEELAEAKRAAAAGPETNVTEYRGLLVEWDTLPLEARREALRRVIRRVWVWSDPRPCRVTVVPTWEEDDSSASA
ncbi:recombinase family protein [Micromonospora carbonacea]|uniref:recombinase family protein n=1 Tax=Micromonospora carbonacea TaxID=47853 RepID=UPI003711BE35